MTTHLLPSLHCSQSDFFKVNNYPSSAVSWYIQNIINSFLVWLAGLDDFTHCLSLQFYFGPFFFLSFASGTVFSVSRESHTPSCYWPLPRLCFLIGSMLPSPHLPNVLLESHMLFFFFNRALYPSLWSFIHSCDFFPLRLCIVQHVWMVALAC